MRRGHARVLLIASLVAGTLAGTSPPAGALFHLMRVREVFAGVAGAPNAQYIELQAYQFFQAMLTGHKVQVFDAAGEEVGSFTFTGNVANVANQATVLVATPDAESFFGVAADLEMTAVLPAGGGKACFEDIDCVSWGSFEGPQADPSASGTPFNRAEGIPAGAAVERDVSGGADPDALEESDDTNDSAGDFGFGAPTPTNNLGMTGEAPGGTLSFDAGGPSAAEDGGAATVQVTRSGGTGEVQVDYATADLSALEGTDYTGASGALIFADGEASKTFEVPISDDGREEGPERVRLRLRDPTGGAVLGTPNGALTIEDDEPDTRPPGTRIRRPRDGASFEEDDVPRFRGTAQDAHSGVARVQFALRQLRRNGSCRWWDGDGFVPGPCTRKNWNLAEGTDSWLIESIPLPRSTGAITNYALYTRGVDEVGNRERRFGRGRNANRFEVT